MTRFFRIFACVMLMFACSTIVVSQELDDAYRAFMQGYHDEFASSPEQSQKQMEYWNASNQIEQTRNQKIGELIQKRWDDLGLSDPRRWDDLGFSDPQAESMKVAEEIIVSENLASRKPIAEKAREIFSDEQYLQMQQRQFQLRESLMRRMESLNDDEDVLLLGKIEDYSHIVGDGQPNFLELTPEQQDLITRQQKDMMFEIRMLLNNQTLMQKNNSMTEYVEKNKEIRRLDEELGNMSPEMRGSEEAMAIQRQIKKINNDMLKDAFPELKKILLKSREDYMRVLTDAQKAKIKAVMDDMPDYMKNLFAEIDRQGGGLSILQLWQPGMGVPDGPNPNREAPRERTNRGERTFPE